MTDMTFFVPRELHLPLAALGSAPWYHCAPPTRVGDRMRASFRLDRRAIADRGGPVIERIIDAIKDSGGFQDSVDILELGALSRCLAGGPKLLTLDADICEALRDIEVRVSLDDYRQPYDNMIVKLDAGWAERVAAQAPGAAALPVLLLDHDRHNGILTTMAVPAHGRRVGGDSVTLCVMAEAGHVIEDTIDRPTIVDGPDDRYGGASRTFERIAINAAMLATYAGVKGAGWLDPQGHARHERLARRGARGRKLLVGDVAKMVFDQQVKLDFVVRVRDRPDRGDGTHRSPYPHNRKRHWCMQPHGPGHKLRKLILRRGSFVRLDAFVKAGHDPSELHTSYASTPATDDPSPGA